jgi:hypothetical protein
MYYLKYDKTGCIPFCFFGLEMLIAFFDIKGVLRHGYLPTEQAINQYFFKDLLKILKNCEAFHKILVCYGAPKLWSISHQRSFSFGLTGKANFCPKADYNDATPTLHAIFLVTFYFSKVKRCSLRNPFLQNATHKEESVRQST